MNKKEISKENEGPLTRADVVEVVTEIVNGAMTASEERMMRRMDLGFERIDERFERVDERFDKVDKRFGQIDTRFEHIDARFEHVDEKFEYAHQGMMSGFELVHEKLEVVSERLDRYIGQNATILSKMDHRVAKLEDHITKLRTRPA